MRTVVQDAHLDLAIVIDSLLKGGKGGNRQAIAVAPSGHRLREHQHLTQRRLTPEHLLHLLCEGLR